MNWQRKKSEWVHMCKERKEARMRQFMVTRVAEVQYLSKRLARAHHNHARECPHLPQSKGVSRDKVGSFCRQHRRRKRLSARAGRLASKVSSKLDYGSDRTTNLCIQNSRGRGLVQAYELRRVDR